ncbi:MAG: hypothetical protein ACK5N8_04995 [Alphaproteobacteria bacterium]
MSDSFYNQDEELLFAFINKNKTEREILCLGYNNYQTKIESERIYNLSRRKYAVEFLRLAEDKVSEFSHQDIIKILQALTAAGVSTQDVNSIEYWFQILEDEVTKRISNYILLSERGESYAAKSRSTNSKKSETVVFSHSDVGNFLEMLLLMKDVLQQRTFSEVEVKEKRRNSEKLKYALMVEKILRKDLKPEKSKKGAKEKEKSN